MGAAAATTSRMGARAWLLLCGWPSGEPGLFCASTKTRPRGALHRPQEPLEGLTISDKVDRYALVRRLKEDSLRRLMADLHTAAANGTLTIRPRPPGCTAQCTRSFGSNLNGDRSAKKSFKRLNGPAAVGS